MKPSKITNYSFLKAILYFTLEIKLNKFIAATFFTYVALASFGEITGNHRTVQVGRLLWRLSSPPILIRAGSPRASCPGLCPVQF